jgi:hypothetical protein
MGSLPRRRKPSSRIAGTSSVSGASSHIARGFAAAQEGIRFQALMHFSSYWMIAAMVIMGLQLAYAFYQLAAFFL